MEDARATVLSEASALLARMGETDMVLALAALTDLLDRPDAAAYLNDPSDLEPMRAAAHIELALAQARGATPLH
jgi:hypothetical protein